jgi:tyrosinase
VPRKKNPVLIGAAKKSLSVTNEGASTTVDVRALPDAAAAGEQRVYLNLADIQGAKNPGVVYGVYLNLPEGAKATQYEDYYVGPISFFGIEASVPVAPVGGGRASHPMRYNFDVTAIVNRLRAAHDWDPKKLRVQLLPIEHEGDEPAAAAAVVKPIKIGTVGIYQA